ncbi:MAG TPA: M1 family metallopeptidase, partial [Longimicrobiaceae bacterium]|nr:M1 family metallopeptidase [Longimicrobiaceae bacterium]
MWRRTSVILALAGSFGCASAPAVEPAPSPPPPAGQSVPDQTDAERPIPYPVTYPPAFQQALASGTRSESGAPGPDYWQNWADYTITTRLLPDDKRVEGSESIRYQNRSPDNLRQLVLDLNLNVHAPGAVRNEPAEVTGGVELTRVAVNGQVLSEGVQGGSGYVVRGTKMIIVPPAPVAAGATVELGVDWAFDVPQAGAGGRMGYDDDNLFFLAYWYPQMAVYDDVIGWHPDPFLGTAEFYSDFGNYNVTVEAPEGWVILGTGELRNPAEVLSPEVHRRYTAAATSDTVVQVLTPADFTSATADAADGWLSWSFQADSVRDVAYSATRESIWDRTRTAVGDRDGDGDVDYTVINALYREPAFRWHNAAAFEQHSISFLSDYTDYPYPWPHMTAVEGAGIIGGGMEYPMMTLIGDYNDASDEALYGVIVHELAHMWVPMIVGVDERRYSWMDEGTTTFNETMAQQDFYPGSNPLEDVRGGYIRVALAGMEGEMMRRSDYHYAGPAFGIASYSKPATVLVALRGVLGEETFNTAYREFIDRWAFKHPQPWDMWNTFEDI